MKFRKIPDETVRRLPFYLRGLLLFAEQGWQNVSSNDLAEMLHVKPPQIRKDLSYFGDFGTRGVGYNTDKLAKELRTILNLNHPHKVALIGYGNLGAAIMKFPGFAVYGLEVVSIFEKDRRKIGRVVRNITIQDFSRIGTLKRKGVSMAIVAVPASSAQSVAGRLVAAGVRGILNFAPAHCLDLPGKVKVITIDIGMDIARLPYYLPVGA